MCAWTVRCSNRQTERQCTEQLRTLVKMQLKEKTVNEWKLISFLCQFTFALFSSFPGVSNSRVLSNYVLRPLVGLSPRLPSSWYPNYTTLRFLLSHVQLVIDRNNLIYYPRLGDRHQQLTSTGQDGLIFNGLPDLINEGTYFSCLMECSHNLCYLAQTIS